MTLILSNADVEKLLTMPECIEALEQSYVELIEGRGVNRTRSDCITPSGRIASGSPFSDENKSTSPT